MVAMVTYSCLGNVNTTNHAKAIDLICMKPGHMIILIKSG